MVSNKNNQTPKGLVVGRPHRLMKVREPASGLPLHSPKFLRYSQSSTGFLVPLSTSSRTKGKYPVKSKFALLEDSSANLKTSILIFSSSDTSRSFPEEISFCISFALNSFWAQVFYFQSAHCSFPTSVLSPNA